MPKVLIVDDSQELADFFCILLSYYEKYTVETAYSKNVMLNRLSTFVPDIILLDVLLSGANGRDLCREIKQANATKHIPIILLSASPEYLKDYEECEATDVIEKPFEISTVIEKIDKALSF